MTRMLYLKSSPRAQRSWSMRVAEAIAEAALNDGIDVDALDLFSESLPELDETTLANKYAIMHGQDVTPEHRDAWGRVEAVIERFTSADAYLLAVPMWNFSIPYRLKHYLDVILQPGYTFAVSDDGYGGLLADRPAVVVYSSGGDYSDAPAAAMDMQKPYLQQVLEFMGIGPVETVVMAPTVQGGREAAELLATRLEARAAGLSRWLRSATGNDKGN